MSFYFNPSSEDEDDEEEDLVPTVMLASSGQNGTPATFCGNKPSADLQECSGSARSTEDDEEDSEEDVDWEDASMSEDDQTTENGTVDNKVEENLPSNFPDTANATHKALQVTVDLDEKPKAETKRSRKRCRLNKIQNLPSDAKSLLLDIHRAHMLTLTSRAMQTSQYCSDQTLSHVAHSLVPPNRLDSWCASQENKMSSSGRRIPSTNTVREFCNWFFDLVNKTEQRRAAVQRTNRRAGAPINRNRRRKGKGKKPSTEQMFAEIIHSSISDTVYVLLQICEYLSQIHDVDPQLYQGPAPNITSLDKTLLCIAVARSLGWRVRFVTILEPVGRELDLNHPLLANATSNLFHLLTNKSDQVGDARKRARKSSQTYVAQNVASMPAKKEVIDLLDGGSDDDDGADITIMSRGKEAGNGAKKWNQKTKRSGTHKNQDWPAAWLEILATPVENNGRHRKIGSRWIHVDPSRELVNQPEKVESCLKERGEVRKRNAHVGYVLGVRTRQASGRPWNHLVDVTPRYANSWSKTLRLRGATGKQIASNGGKCVDIWWSETMRKSNFRFQALHKGGLERSAKAHGNNDEAMKSSQVSSKKADRLGKKTNFSDYSDGNCSSEDESNEKHELKSTTAKESIPTSKAAFKKHHLYVIPSVLNSDEVLQPDAKKRICGLFKGELVYRRSDVSITMPAKKWLYSGRKVRQDEIGRPVQRRKARKKATKQFKALKSYGVGEFNDGSEEARKRDIAKASELDSDGMEDLYGKWQTEAWSPAPVGPNDVIPVNEYNNVELELLNPGLVHLQEARMSVIAKKLGIPYAPCLLGFEGHGGNRTPTIRGIVVHEHNVDLLREAHSEWESHSAEKEVATRQENIYDKWKKLIVGLMTKARLEREYT